jgi:hypothetical protein
MKRVLIALALLSLSIGSAIAQFAPVKYFSVVGTNSTLVLGRQAYFGGGAVSNTTATVYYFKLYNKATAPVCGTDIPVWTVALPASITTTLPTLSEGVTFGLGVGFCITGALADNDTTNAAVGIVVDLAVSGR